MMSRPLSTWRLAIASGVSCWGITRSSFLKFESYSSCVVDLIGPRVNDGVLVEVIHGGHEPILEFLLGGNANVAQHRARKFGKEALDEVEPGAVLRREDKFVVASAFPLPIGLHSTLS